MTPAFSIERVDATRSRIRGRIGFAEATAALACSAELLGGDQKAVDVDVGALQGIDSATLAVLLAWSARAARAGIAFRVVHAPPELKALAQLCDAEPLLGIN